MTDNALPPGEMRRQVRPPERVAGIGNLRPFRMTDAGVDGVGALRRTFDPFRLVGQQRFMDATPMGKIGDQFELRTRLQKLHRRRDAEQGTAPMCFVINRQAVPLRQRRAVVEKREIFLQREMIATGVGVQIERFQLQGTFILPLEPGLVLGHGPSARPPLLRDDGQTQFIERPPGALAGFLVEWNIQLDAVKAAAFDFFELGFDVRKFI